jgi:hypothetical protein
MSVRVGIYDMYVCLSFRLSEDFASFYETWRKHCMMRVYPNVLVFKFPQSVTITWRML